MTVALALLFAQAAAGAPAISEIAAGGAGWTVSGLLAAVLYWIAFHHLPGKDKLLKDVIDATAKQQADKDAVHATQIAALIDTQRATLAEQIAANNATSNADRVEYQKSLDRVTAHCEREMTTVTSGMIEQLRSLRAAIEESREESRDLHQESRHAINNVANAVGLKVATGEIKLRAPKPEVG